MGLVLVACPPVAASTVLGLAPTASGAQAFTEAARNALQAALTNELGQNVTIRVFDSEAVLADWMLRFQEVDAALISQAFQKQQPAGALSPLANITLTGSGVPLLLVVRQGLPDELPSRWQRAVLNGRDDAQIRQAMTQAGIIAYELSQAAPPPYLTTGKNEPATAPQEPSPASAAAVPAAAETSVAPRFDLPADASVATAIVTPVVLQPEPDSRTRPETAREESTTTAGTESLAPAGGTTPLRTETTWRLSLPELIRLVVDQNQRILMEQAGWQISKANEEKAHAIFEPAFVASARLNDTYQQNTVEEALTRDLERTYSEHNWRYNATLEGRLPTGGNLELGYNLHDLSTSVTESLADEDHEYQMYLGVKLTQPLLKNAGIDITRTGIRIAEVETRSSFQDYRRELMRNIGLAAKSYWELFLAQEMLTLRSDSVRIASELLNDNRERQRFGKMAETEVLEAQAGVTARQVFLSEAHHEHLQALNNLRKALSVAVSPESPAIETAAPLPTARPVLDKEASIRRAMQQQPEMLAALERLQQADIKIAYARNQRWPELDLSASYGLNGLDFSQSDAWGYLEDGDYESWSVGLEFRLPLLGDIDSRSDLKKVQLEKKRQLWLIKDTEVHLVNNVDTAISGVQSAARQQEQADSVVAIYKQLLDTELVRLKSGKSSTRLVLEREDSYRRARESSLENTAKLQNALIDLEVAEGSILLNNGVEITGETL